MTDEYIRKHDAIAVAESYQVERTGFHLNDYEYGRNQVADSIASDLEDIKPADVAPYSVSPDGTLIITVPKGTTANRVLVEWEGAHCGGLYYAD